MAKIRSPGLKWASKLLDGWTLSNCDLDQSSMLWESQGRKNVFVLNGLTKGRKTYVLAKNMILRPGKPLTLEFAAACDPKTDGWKISVKADGQGACRRDGEPGDHERRLDADQSIAAGHRGQAAGRGDHDGACDAAHGEERPAGPEHHGSPSRNP